MTRKKRNHRHAANGINITKMVESSVILPPDGSAVQVPLPEGITFFISEDGKLMFQKKQQEPANAPENFGITYEEIAEKLYLGKRIYFSDGFEIKSVTCNSSALLKGEDNCRSEAQVLKYLAYNKLLNIATYLNNGWTPVFGKPFDEAYAIGYNKDGKVSPVACYSYNVGLVLFPSKYICEQAIRIMGKKSIHDLLNYEY